MKYFLLFFGLVLSIPAFSQDSINPYNIQQHGNIILHNTDVYYNPFAPPDPTTSRDSLSNEVSFLTNPNGNGSDWPPYQPKVRGIGETRDTLLEQWSPCGDSVGQYAVWQRLFQGDTITAGGAPGDTVTISANEDVDFRAKHLIKLKSGFHVKPGAFFHAYTEPHWGDSVFSDEFDDTAKFDSLWQVGNGSGANAGGEGVTCAYDSNVRLVADPDAHDGHALDIMIWEDTVDSCHCFALHDQPIDSCGDFIGSDSVRERFIFATGKIRSCPFPFTQRVDTPFEVAYAHEPYGKYEFRDKIPHFMHHTNNWGSGGVNGQLEFDINETATGADMSRISPTIYRSFKRGPYKGIFSRANDTVIFISSQPGWCAANSPSSILIGNIMYPVQQALYHGPDTLSGAYWNQYLQFPDWPASLANDMIDSVSFYYTFNSSCTADLLPWTVNKDGSGNWTIFSASYHTDESGHPVYFTKDIQPTSITLTTSLIPIIKKTYTCHWDSTLSADSGKGILLLDAPGMDSILDLHSGDEQFTFNIQSQSGYPTAPVPFNGNDSTGYQYHTFAMEWLPNEVRFLVDSMVVRRFPDRMVPPGNHFSNWIAAMPRGTLDLLPAELLMDLSGTDTLGTDTSHRSGGWWGMNSLTYVERQSFEHAASIPGWAGFWPVNGRPTAHHLLDYIKVWDVPADVIIPNFPH
jgi:hypothetical protein